MNTFGDLPWSGFEPGTSGSQSDALPLSQSCSEETDEFSLQYNKVSRKNKLLNNYTLMNHEYWVSIDYHYLLCVYNECVFLYNSVKFCYILSVWGLFSKPF